ncbi:MAG: ABC transporter permease [Candidatus Nomurabacteria bacterium]|jgi:putative ABC transport system permease protein|nr:ABC transporter permease [Candidatus Nomurabacteria bacterium]
MFKNMLKRSWLSTIRKPSRTIILVLILFVMANMLLATIAIKNSVNSSMQYAKDKIGGTVYLSVDSEKMRANREAQTATGDEATGSFTMPTISEDLAIGLADSSYIKDYTYSLSTTANASGFTVVETAQNERERQFQSAFNDARDQMNNAETEYNAERDRFNSSNSGAAPGGGGMGGGTRPNFSFDFNVDIGDPSLSRGDTEVQGINSFDFVSGIEDGSISVVSGTSFDENTENGVMISQELADANSLAVGGELKLKTTADETEQTYTITGIYQSTTEGFNNNTVYTNIAGAKKLLSSTQLESVTVESVHYYLNSASDKAAFLAEAATKYPTLADDGLKLDIDDSSYQTMVGPIENVGSFANTILWVVVIAAVVIITLIVAINIKDRRYEMGVLLSLGARRTNILGQIFLELVIVGTIGFLTSLGTSQVLAKKMGEDLLQQQITSSQETAQTPSAVGGRNIMIGGGQPTTTQEQIKEIDVRAGTKEYATLFGSGYLILIIAMILPSINILRYQPKTILTSKE